MKCDSPGKLNLNMRRITTVKRIILTYQTQRKYNPGHLKLFQGSPNFQYGLYKSFSNYLLQIICFHLYVTIIINDDFIIFVPSLCAYFLTQCTMRY